MSNPNLNLNSQVTQTSDKTSSSTAGKGNGASFNGSHIETGKNSNQPNKAQQTQSKKNDLSKHMTQVAADTFGGNFKRVDGNGLPESYKNGTKTTHHFEDESLKFEANTYLKNQPNEPEQNQNDGQPKEQPNPQRPNGQPNLNKVSNPERTSTADEASETKGASEASKIGNKKEANNDGDSGVNLAEFFRAKNNIDLHQSKNGKGEKLDDALVQCLRKVPGVKIIKSRFFEKFGEPVAIQYYGVRLSFHDRHGVASGEKDVRKIVQNLLTKIKSMNTASDNMETSNVRVDPQAGKLIVGGHTYKVPVPQKGIIVLNQNSNGDCAFDHEALKDPNSSTSKVATQLITLSKTSTLCQKYFPGIDFEKSVSQMKNNSSDPERSKNNVHPFKQGSFQTVSKQLNVVSSWVDNSTNDILQQGLGVLYPDLLLDIYDVMYAQEEEATKDQQNRARAINERAREIAERTINEYNLFSGQKLEENSERAAKAFLERLHQDNPQILALESSFANSDSRIGLTREDMERTIAQRRNAIMQGALEAARQAQNVQAPRPDDFPNSISNSEPASSSEDNDLSSGSNSSLEVFNNNKNDQFSNSNDTENDDPENLNAQPSVGAAAEEDGDPYIPGENPFD